MIPAHRVVLGCVVACSAVSALVPARPAAALPGPGAGAVETGAVELLDRAHEAAETQA